MRNLVKLILVLAGVSAILMTLSMPRDPTWGLLLGVGLIFAPVGAAALCAAYLLLLVILVGPGLMLGLLAAEIFGKSSIAIGVAWAVGLFLGFKLSLASWSIVDRVRSHLDKPR